MSNAFVVDAHALVWYLEGNPRLGAGAKQELDDPANALYLPIIALAEACWVVARGKSAIPSVGALLSDVDSDPRIVVMPLDRAILNLSLSLPQIQEMHDRQISATALLIASQSGESVPLLTRDEDITASGIVPVIW